MQFLERLYRHRMRLNTVAFSALLVWGGAVGLIVSQDQSFAQPTQASARLPESCDCTGPTRVPARVWLRTERPPVMRGTT